MNEDKLYERETHLYYNDLEDKFNLETYDASLKNTLKKNKNCNIDTKNIKGIGTLYLIEGYKKDLNIDIYK